jgi:predicted dehydrogenase
MKIAILGTGKVARNSYLPFLSEQEDVELLYYSRTREKADACAVDFGGRVADSVEQLLAEDPDSVLVLTHETQRYEAAMSLLAGKPRRLFCEKPLVAAAGQANVSEDDFLKARELLQRAGAVGTETAMVFNYRFFEQTLRAQELVAARDFGQLTQASLFVNYACWSHCIDLLHLFGGRAARIAALSGAIEYKDAVDVAAALQMENGATGTIVGTSSSDFNAPLYDVLFNFEQGSIRFRDLDGPLEVHVPGSRYAETHALIGHHSRWDQYQASFEKSLAAYLASIRNGEPPPVPGMAGLEELQFEAALRRSVREQRPVDVAREFPLDQ